MKAILTKYHSPTNTKGSRISAHAEGVKSIYRSFDYTVNQEDLYKNVAIELCKIYDWPTDLLSGSLPNGDVVFVFKDQ